MTADGEKVLGRLDQSEGSYLLNTTVDGKDVGKLDNAPLSVVSLISVTLVTPCLKHNV
jgi:hypothetical protein